MSHTHFYAPRRRNKTSHFRKRLSFVLGSSQNNHLLQAQAFISRTSSLSFHELLQTFVAAAGTFMATAGTFMAAAGTFMAAAGTFMAAAFMGWLLGAARPWGRRSEARLCNDALGAKWPALGTRCALGRFVGTVGGLYRNPVVPIFRYTSKGGCIIEI